MPVCPKCEKEGKFGYFDTPDETGITGYIEHKKGYKKIKDCLGQERIVVDCERHFVTVSELESTDWFKDWKTKRNEEMQKNKINMDKLYQEEYFNSLEKEDIK